LGNLIEAKAALSGSLVPDLATAGLPLLFVSDLSLEILEDLVAAAKHHAHERRDGHIRGRHEQDNVPTLHVSLTQAS
jgi:hypothetical protein